MSSNIYALLVGINDYSPTVGKLSGCINDVDGFHDYLTDNFDPAALRIEVLKDADATRANIISQFRAHLGKATSDDVVVFQYCGHGAQSKSAKAFEQFYPIGKDEGLVCFDSREPGGFDLADKELAVLLAELAAREPHIAVILDCCHSGSATRGADDFAALTVRQTHERSDERPLESYLGGYYDALGKRGQSLAIPLSRHISLAACERVQKAWETKSFIRHGLFSHTLFGILEKTGPNIPYADLFVRCRAQVRRLAENQEPQFETFKGFNAYSGFLGSRTQHTKRRYSVHYVDKTGWQLDCGAIHGLPSDADKPVELALYREGDSTRAGQAVTASVGAQTSILEMLDVDAEPSVRFQAEVISLPLPPLPVFIDAEEAGKTPLLQSWTEQGGTAGGIALAEEPAGARYRLTAKNDQYLLSLAETGRLIQGAKGYSAQSVAYMLDVLQRIAAWERTAALRNDATKMNPDDVEFRFYDAADTEDPVEFAGSDVTLDIVKRDGEWSKHIVALKANNLTSQPLHFALLLFTEDYGFEVVYNERIEPTRTMFPVTGTEQPTFHLYLDDDEGNQVTYAFKLLVSTEKVDDFLLNQEGLSLGHIYAPAAHRGTTLGSGGKGQRSQRLYRNEWFTRDIRVRLARQLDRVGADDTSIANRQITIKGHPSLQAGISMGTAKTAARSVGAGAGIYRVLERRGMELLNFSRTRGEDESVLELTDIRNPEVLADHPLEIELAAELADDEIILPLAFDGEHILLTGDPRKNAAGRVEISIGDIPDAPNERRSLGKALKLYFFKTVLKRDNVNRLCWVDYGEDGSATRRVEGVAEKLAAAKNVLLLIHGIIGDTQGMAEGMKLARDASERSLSDKFDLVLTYDYENLSTPISDTALALKQQLNEAGVNPQDDKRLTLLVHSMGGLVSRWLIEREGGSRFVDHLIMCGTPNVGSPFGRIDGARKLSKLLTTLAINSFPAFAVVGGALIYVLNKSEKLTPCLEQMNPTSDFIQRLNDSEDPCIRYTIVAADAREYREDSDDVAASLIAKLGRGMLFDTLYRDAAHDIAVSLQSILGVNAERTPAPVTHKVIGHHLNYFTNDDSLRILAAIE